MRLHCHSLALLGFARTVFLGQLTVNRLVVDFSLTCRRQMKTVIDRDNFFIGLFARVFICIRHIRLVASYGYHR